VNPAEKWWPVSFCTTVSLRSRQTFYPGTIRLGTTRAYLFDGEQILIDSRARRTGEVFIQGTVVMFPCHLANIATGDQGVDAAGSMSAHDSGHGVDVGGGCDGSEGEEAASMYASLGHARGAHDVVLKRVRAALLAGPVVGRGRGGDDNAVGDASDARRGRRRLGLAGRGRMRPALTKWQGGRTEVVPSSVNGSNNDASSPARNVNQADCPEGAPSSLGSGNDATSPAGNVNPCIRVELKKDVVPETDCGVQAEVADTGSNNG
jgi:hypothetical protein